MAQGIAQEVKLRTGWEGTACSNCEIESAAYTRQKSRRK